MGEERTRRELIPFLNDNSDDEDEVLLVMAEELGKFVALVGGPQYAHYLLLPLETLATVDETVVRERSVESLCSVGAQMPELSLAEHFVPLIKVISWIAILNRMNCATCKRLLCISSSVNTKGPNTLPVNT